MKLTPTERKALLDGCNHPKGKFSCARTTTLTNLVKMSLATRALVDGPEGSEPSPAMYNGIVTEYGRAAVKR